MHLFQPVVLPVGELVWLVLAGDDHLHIDDDDDGGEGGDDDGGDDGGDDDGGGDGGGDDGRVRDLSHQVHPVWLHGGRGQHRSVRQ